MGDIVFPVGKADEESCPLSARGQFFISWQQGEGAFVLVGTGCQSTIFMEHLLCRIWKGGDRPCPQEACDQREEDSPSTVNPLALMISFEMESTRWYLESEPCYYSVGGGGGRLATSVLPESLLEMQDLEPCCRPPESESALDQISTGSVCTRQFQRHLRGHSGGESSMFWKNKSTWFGDETDRKRQFLYLWVS